MYKWGIDQSSTTAGVVEPITKSDDTGTHTTLYKAITCSAAGTIKFTALNGVEVSGYPVQAGENRIGVRGVFDTGTDAITIFGLNS